jgi:copper(I)-binding protein
MKINFAKGLIALLTSLALLSATQAHEYQLGEIQIIHPAARATVAQQSTGAAYLTLENRGKTDDSLIKIESGVADSVEMHNMEMVGDVMKMRAVDTIELKAGNKVSMKSGGGYHLMLIGLKKPLNVGDTFPLTLIFAKGGKIEVMVHVEGNK